MLPEPGEAAEDAYVREWSESDDTDGLIEAITAAMGARRPLLAARLVNLLEDHVEIEEGSAVDRARRAARLVLHDAGAGAGPVWEELEAAWDEARQRRMHRIKRRMRRSLEGRHESIPRVGRRPRKR